MATHKSSRIRSKRPTPVAAPFPSAPLPHSPSTNPLADVPDPPGIELTDKFFKALADVVEQLGIARTDLMQIHGLARCLEDVLTYADDDDSPMHADVAHVIARLLDEVVTSLELMKNQIPANKELARSVMGDSDKAVEV